MSQVTTTRATRARRSRKLTSQEMSLLGTRRGEPLISGVTDGETFHLIVDPPQDRRSGAATSATPSSLFDGIDPLPAVRDEPNEVAPETLREMGLSYRFALGCCTRDEQD